METCISDKHPRAPVPIIFRITILTMRERKGGNLLPVAPGTGCGGLCPGEPYLVGEVRSAKLWTLETGIQVPSYKPTDMSLELP